MTRLHGALLAGAAVIAAVAIYLAGRGDPPEVTAPAPVERRAARPERPQGTRPMPEPLASGDGDSTEPGAAVKKLEELAWFDDPDSLTAILAELENPDPRVRGAALAAVRQFGSRDAIPRLQVLAAATRDPVEKKALEDAVAYLELPTMLEEIDGNPPASEN